MFESFCIADTDPVPLTLENTHYQIKDRSTEGNI
jgi:hypothetical protein